MVTNFASSSMNLNTRLNNSISSANNTANRQQSRSFKRQGDPDDGESDGNKRSRANQQVAEAQVNNEDSCDESDVNIDDENTVNNYFDSEVDIEEMDSQYASNGPDDNGIRYENESYSGANESSTSNRPRRNKHNACLQDKTLLQEIIQVNCNSIVAELHKSKFGSGGKGHCIRVLVDNRLGTNLVDKQNTDQHQSATNKENTTNDESSSSSSSSTSSGKSEEKWMTPIEFENYCGKGNCRDWKRTIKAGGQSLLALLEARILICHAVSCSCAVCNRNDSLVGPIKPFIRYRRRKRDEIMAENAFKKFLSLKPPTLFRDNLLTKMQNQSVTGSSSPKLNNHMMPAAAGSSSSPLSSNSIINSTNKSSISSEAKNLNRKLNQVQTELLSINSVSKNALSSKEQNVSISNNNHNSDSNSNNNASFNNDLYDFIEHMQELEDKKWYSLEKIANDLTVQARNLQTSIQTAKQESEQNRRLLIDKLLSSSLSPLNNSQAYDETSDQNAQQYDHNYPLNSRSATKSAHLTKKSAHTSTQQLKFSQINSNGLQVRRSTPNEQSNVQNVQEEDDDEEDEEEDDHDNEEDDDENEDEEDDEDNEKDSMENKNDNQYEPVQDQEEEEEEELDDDEEADENDQ